MLFLYNIGIHIYTFLILITSFFDRKARLWIEGRKHLLDQIKHSVNPQDKHIWFHFASLGEFEQGRTVIEKIKQTHPGKKLFITFFSPSGYELRKNYPLADYVFYLPADTAKNAKEFIQLINPEFAVFTKYDYWLNYFLELKKHNVKLYVISAIFHPQYSFFMWYGVFSRAMLKLVTLFFVQDERSKELLKTINISNVIVNGDTRFDRVAENASKPKSIPLVEEFLKGSKVLVAGSTWPEDEKLLLELAKQFPDWKLIVAPHEVNESRIAEAVKLFGGSAIFLSQLDIPQIANRKSQILIINNIGMLSSLYQYGDVAYIGGGFGAGIHNTLEAAAFNIPIIFGFNYQRFREAVELLEQKAAFTVKTLAEIKQAMQELQDENTRKQAGLIAGKYVQERTGATDEILRYILNQHKRLSEN